jgi:hypothetical protein
MVEKPRGGAGVGPHSGRRRATPSLGKTGSMPSARRFPPPWSVEETDACFIVRDGNRQALAYVYFEEEPGRRSAAHLLTRDEARRIGASCRSCWK